MTRLNKFCWTAINDTPFTTAIVLPETYGLSTIKGQLDATSYPDYSKYFTSNDWYVHPDWVYCYVNPRNRGDPMYKSLSPEAMVKLFLNRWREEGEKAIDWIGSLETNAGGIASTKLLFCKKISMIINMTISMIKLLLYLFFVTGDRELIERLIFDAKFTNINFDQCKSNSSR